MKSLNITKYLFMLVEHKMQFFFRSEIVNQKGFHEFIN